MSDAAIGWRGLRRQRSGKKASGAGMLESRGDEEGGDGEVQGAWHDRGARLRASNPSSSGKRKTGSWHDSTHPAVIATLNPPPALV